MLEQQLRAIPFLRNVPAAALGAVAGRLRFRKFDPGDVVFRRGDPSDSMYLVQSGQVDVLLEGDAIPADGQEPLASLGPGSFVGELGLLLDEPRSATLVVSSEAELWALDREDLDALLQEFPVLAIDLTRELGRRLVATNRRIMPPLVTRFATVWGDGAVSLAKTLLETGSGRIGIAALAGAPAGAVPEGVVEIPGAELEPEQLAGWAGTRVHDLDHLLIVLPPAVSAPARAAVDIAEHCVAFEPGHPGWVMRSALRRRVLQADLSGPSLRRTARWLAGRAVGLALSSGGSKSLAHIGVIRVLTEAGVQIDAVAGTSGGALAAAGLACSVPEERVLEWARELDRNTRFRRFDVNIPPRSALFKGVRLRNLFDRWLDGRSFGDATIPLWAVAADVATGEEVVISEGRLADGLRASMSIPGAFVPWRLQGRILIDGAVVNPMPASVLRDAGIRHVIGSTVAGQDIITGRAAQGHTPHMLQIMSRMMNSMEREMIKAQIPLVDILIRPKVSASSSFDFSQFEAFIAEGERAARASLDDIRALLAR